MKSGSRFLLLIFLALVGWVIVKGWSRGPRDERDTSPALRGEQVARRLGCFGCHGPEGEGGVADPLLPGGGIPGWAGGVLQSYAKDSQEIREWILDGVPARLAKRPPEARSTGLVPMPPYRDLLSPEALEELMAYVLAVAEWDDSLPEAAYEGRALSHRLGCFGCHGPSGIGGMENPGSFKGVIPAWTGEWFSDLVRDDDELRAWILDGRIPRFENDPLALHYLEGQRIQMPAYREHLSDAEVELLLAYVHWLRKDDP